MNQSPIITSLVYFVFLTVITHAQASTQYVCLQGRREGQGFGGWSTPSFSLGVARLPPFFETTPFWGRGVWVRPHPFPEPLLIQGMLVEHWTIGDMSGSQP